PMAGVETYDESASWSSEASRPVQLEVQTEMAPPVFTEPQQPSKLLFLSGYRGAGKTSVAQWVATKLGWQWIDADTYLEQSVGRTIREIFDTEGEAVFREHEANLLNEFCQLDEHVVATGGGAIMSEDNR